MSPANEDQGIPTISRVCSDTLIELVYDRASRQTGLVVSRFGGLWNVEQEVRIETGELLIPYSPRNNLIASECVLLPSRPVEYGFKSELIADIRAFLHRYIDLNEGFEGIAAYYILLSWVYDAFNDLPYLRFRGDYGTGKTRALLTVGALCYRSFFASGASTVSPIFHTQDTFAGTLVLDEADFQYSDARAELVKLLNNGNTRGIPVLRSIINRHREFNPYAFKVFGPKLIAMRDEFQDRALESRFITEETGSRPVRSDIPIYLTDAFKAESLELRNRLLHFRLCEFYKIAADPNAVMEGAEARLNQTSLSLLSLIDEGPDRIEAQAFLRAQYERFSADRQQSPEARVLGALCEAVAKRQGPASVGDVARRFNESSVGEQASSKWIGYILRTKLRLHTERLHGIYVVPASENSKIAALAQRYGISDFRIS